MHIERQASSVVRASAASTRASVSVRVLTGLAIGALLYLGHAAFIPIALAVLFSLILTAPVEALHQLGLPRSLSAILVLVLLGTLIGISVNLLWTPAQNWWASAPQTLKTIERKVRPLSQFMNRLEVLSSRADQLADAGAAVAIRAPERAAEAPPPPSVVATPSPDPATQATRTPIAVQILDQTGTVVMSIVTVMMLMLFLLTGGPPMLARMSASLATDLQSTHTLGVINAVRSELSCYYGCLAIINLGLGVATVASMSLLGMPNPVLWGVVAATLNFIPYVGSATTLLLLTVVAFVTFSNLGHVALVAASYLALATLEGQVVQPLVVGRRLELNPIIVFLALWFGGWFWGVAGIVIAVPTLVSLKVVAEKSKGGKTLTEFLSPEDTRMRQLVPSAGKKRVIAAVTSAPLARPGR
jgi:predicted PurR-regulated permease PerM